jgi:hypothetical protein
MAKVFSIHELALKPGVTAEEFEQFANEVGNFGLPGWKCYFVKGSRGARAGQYDVIMEFASVERRDQLYPTEGTMNEEVQQYMASAAGQDLLQRWGRLASGPGDRADIYTDYEVLGE